MRHRRILLLFLGFFAALATATYVVLVHTGASRSLVENVMARFIRGSFGLRDAAVDPAAGIVRIEGVHIDHPTLARRRIFDVDHIVLDVSTNPLGSEGIGTVRRVRIEKANLDVSLTEGEQWDLKEILHLPELATGPDAYPAVIVTESTVTLRLSDDRPQVQFTSVELELLPEEPGSPRMVLAGSMVTPSGFAVRIRGSGDLEQGEFHALFETEDLPLLPAVARPYSLAAERYLEAANLSGVARKVALWLQYPPEPGDDSAVTARLSADVEDVSATPGELSYPVVGAGGNITASTRDGGRVHFDLLAADGERRISARGDITGCLLGAPLARVLVEGNGIAVDEQLGKALSTIDVGRDIWSAFEPAHGSVDFEALLSHEEPGSKLALSLDLTLNEVGARFAGFAPEPDQRRVSFPYQLEDVTGTVQFRDGELSLGSLTAMRGDGGSLALTGKVTGLGVPPGPDYQIEISGKSMAFSDELRAAVGTLLGDDGATYDAYAPTGRADVEIWVRRRHGEPSPLFHVEIVPLGASASYQNFPYRIDDVRGRIEIGSASVSFDLSGSRGQAGVDVSGRFFLDDSDSALRSELWLQARNAELDPELRHALAVLDPGLDRLWASWSPTGRFDCQLTMWRSAGTAAFEHDLRLDFLSASAEVQRFARRLHELRGSVFVHGSGSSNHIEVNLLRGIVHNGGETAPAEVLLEGSMDYRPEGDAIDMTTILRRLELNEALAQTLDRAKILSRRSWNVLAPSGFVDVICHHDKAPESADIDHRLRVQLRDVRSDAYFLPYPATRLNGEVAVADDVSEFDEITGMVGDAQAFCRDGRIERRDGRTSIAVTIAADHLPVDENFANLMRGPLQRAYIEREVRGSIEIPGLHMQFDVPDEGDTFELVLNGPVIAKDLRMLLVAPVEEINGTFTFAESRISPNDGFVVCDAKDVSLQTLGHRATEAHGRLSAFPTEIRLDALVASLHGGRVRADGADGRAMTFDWQKRELSAQVKWDEMSLAGLMRSAGDPSPEVRGSLSGRLDIERLIGTDLIDMVANGSLEIRNGQLGEVPIFTAIYAFLAPQNRPQFDGVRMDLDLRDRRIAIRSLEVESPLVEITGQGTVGLDGYLDIVLEFPDFFASASSWLFLPKVLQAITSPLVRFHVYGYLRSPHARPRWLFQQDPDRVGLVPIPPRITERPQQPF